MGKEQASFQRSELKNGLRIVSEYIPHVRSVSVGVWFMVGSRDEENDNNGISHFIEHLLFKGTESRSAADIAQSLESVGGSLNAFTGKEVTCYYAHILDEHLPQAIDVISDIISHSVFDEEEMDRERQVIIEELNTLEETPDEMVHEIFIDDMFPNHPLGLSIIGKRDNILNFNRAGTLDYLRENYTLDRIVVAAAGSVEHAQLVSLIEDRFQPLTETSPREYTPPQIPQKTRHVVDNGAIQAHVCLGTQSYCYNDPRKFGLLVLNTLLGAGMSSRLFQNIRERHGMAYSVYSYIDFLCDTGLFGVYIGTDRDKVDDSIALIGKELVALKQHLVSPEELERTKAQLKGNLVLSLESTSSRMNRIAKMEIYLQEHFTVDSTLKAVDEVTAADLLAISEDLFDDNRIVTTILKPRELPDA